MVEQGWEFYCGESLQIHSLARWRTGLSDMAFIHMKYVVETVVSMFRLKHLVEYLGILSHHHGIYFLSGAFLLCLFHSPFPFTSPLTYKCFLLQLIKIQQETYDNGLSNLIDTPIS